MLCPVFGVGSESCHLHHVSVVLKEREARLEYGGHDSAALLSDLRPMMEAFS